MKIKTQDLTGPALDWAVAKCEGFTPHQTYMYDTPTLWKIGHRYSPSTDWAQGGPIIEREKISVYWNKPRQQWIAMHGGYLRFYRGHTTPLIAAMRCYCSAKLGDEVDISEELV